MAYQCKFFVDNFGKSQLRQITKSLEKALIYRQQIGWSEYVVCVPRNLTAQGHESIEEIGKACHVQLSVLQANDLWGLLSEFPSIQNAFFPIRTRNIASSELQAAGLIFEQFSMSTKKIEPATKSLPNSLHPLSTRSRGLLLQVVGDLLSISGNREQALAYYLQAEQFLDHHLDKSDVLRAISSIYLETGQDGLAKQILRRAEKVAPEEIRASVRIDRAELFLLKREYPKAKNEVTQGLMSARRLKQKNEIARAYRINGDIAFDLGDWKTAKKYYGLALNIWQQLGSNYDCAVTLSYLGSILHRQGHLNEALQRLTESVRIFESAGDLPTLAEALTSTNMVLFEMAEWYSSQQYHNRCLQIENILGNIRGQSICFNNLGLLMRVRGDYDESIAYHESALRLSKQVKDSRGMVYANSYLGIIYLNRGELSIARKHFQSARRIAKKISFRFGEALSYLNLAQLEIKNNRITSAIKLAHRGYEEVGEVGGAIEKSRACRVLAEAYLAKKDFKKALRYAMRSSSQFQEIGAPYERALSLQVLSQVQIELGNPQVAEENRARAEELEYKIGAHVDLKSQPSTQLRERS